MAFNNQQAQVQPEQPVFNDVLDILNPNMTFKQKALGVASLPFNAFLHPIHTLQGVMETYNKLASIPLAVYSGNISKVPGILQGTEEFHGKDVLNQAAGAELHGILPSVGGFALDLLSDPFYGAVRLPEEITKVVNGFTIQSAAPLTPQLVKAIKGDNWLMRFAGTGSGTGNDIIYDRIHEEMATGNHNTVGEARQAVEQKMKMKQSQNDARDMLTTLNGSYSDVTSRISSKIIDVPVVNMTEEGVSKIEGSRIGVYNTDDFHNGNKKLHYDHTDPSDPDFIVLKTQEELEKEVLADASLNQDQHSLAAAQAELHALIFNPEEAIKKWAEDDKQKAAFEASVKADPTAFLSNRQMALEKLLSDGWSTSYSEADFYNTFKKEITEYLQLTRRSGKTPIDFNKLNAAQVEPGSFAFIKEHQGFSGKIKKGNVLKQYGPVRIDENGRVYMDDAIVLDNKLKISQTKFTSKKGRRKYRAMGETITPTAEEVFSQFTDLEDLRAQLEKALIPTKIEESWGNFADDFADEMYSDENSWWNLAFGNGRNNILSLLDEHPEAVDWHDLPIRTSNILADTLRELNWSMTSNPIFENYDYLKGSTQYSALTGLNSPLEHLKNDLIEKGFINLEGKVTKPFIWPTNIKKDFRFNIMFPRKQMIESFEVLERPNGFLDTLKYKLRTSGDEMTSELIADVINAFEDLKHTYFGAKNISDAQSKIYELDSKVRELIKSENQDEIARLSSDRYEQVDEELSGHSDLYSERGFTWRNAYDDTLGNLVTSNSGSHDNQAIFDWYDAYAPNFISEGSTPPNHLQGIYNYHKFKEGDSFSLFRKPSEKAQKWLDEQKALADNEPVYIEGETSNADLTGKVITFTGSREATSLSDAVKAQIRAARVIRHGGAKGFDQLVDEYARSIGKGDSISVHLPDYKTHGKDATLIRNREMVDQSEAVVGAIRDDAQKSRGTAYTANYGFSQGKPTYVHDHRFNHPLIKVDRKLNMQSDVPSFGQRGWIGKDGKFEKLTRTKEEEQLGKVNPAQVARFKSEAYVSFYELLKQPGMEQKIIGSMDPEVIKDYFARFGNDWPEAYVKAKVAELGPFATGDILPDLYRAAVRKTIRKFKRDGHWFNGLLHGESDIYQSWWNDTYQNMFDKAWASPEYAEYASDIALAPKIMVANKIAESAALEAELAKVAEEVKPNTPAELAKELIEQQHPEVVETINELGGESAMLKSTVGYNSTATLFNQALELAKQQKLIDEFSDYTATAEQSVEINEAANTDVKAFNNLGADQLEHMINIRSGNVSAYDMVSKPLEDWDRTVNEFAHSKFEGHTGKAYGWKNAIQRHVVDHFTGANEINIKGEEFVKEFMNRGWNFTWFTNKGGTPWVTDIMRMNMEKMHSELGFDLFEIKQLEHPNHHMTKMYIKTEEYMKNREVIDEWFMSHLKSGSTGYKGFNVKFPRQEAKNLGKHQQMFADQLIQILTDANNKFLDRMSYAGLRDEANFEAHNFFPKTTRDFGHVQGQANGEVMDDIINYAGVQISSEMKRKYKLTGAFSSTLNESAVLGSHFSKVFNPNTKKMVYLYSHDPITAYKKLFSSSFAEHENLRISQEIMTADQYKLSNMNIIHLPDTAIADFDIIIPVRGANGEIKDYRRYAPTQANIDKYKNNGYIVSKTVSAETRSLMNFQNLSAKSPAFEWLMRNFIGPYKRGVLQNFAFPLGNAGDMGFKELSTLAFKDWPTHKQNMAIASHAIQRHEIVVRRYATLTSRQEFASVLNDVPFDKYLVDMLEYMRTGNEAEWITKIKAKAKTEDGAALLEEHFTNADENTYENARLYQGFVNTPSSTSNMRDTFLNEGTVRNRRFDEKLNKFLVNSRRHPIGRMLNTVTTENPVSKRINNFNEHLENMMRFSGYLTRTGATVGAPIIDKDAMFLINEVIKYNHMHFAEMPGGSVFSSVLFPFFQYPIKNAIWWGRYIAKNPAMAGMMYKFQKNVWGDDDQSFWAKLGGVPVTDSLIFRGVPGFGSFSTFAMGLEHPTDVMGNRLNPVIRPFLSDNGSTYYPYSFTNRAPQSDSKILAMLHGLNPLEGNLQAGLNIGNPDIPLAQKLAPSVFHAGDQQGQQQESLLTGGQKPGSDFEVDVINRLTPMLKKYPGYKFYPQYPVGTKRIDIAIVDPNGKVVTGIEVDGSEYHDNQQGEDYLRQVSINAYGYPIFRIKETMWDTSPLTQSSTVNQIQKIIDNYNVIKNNKPF